MQPGNRIEQGRIGISTVAKIIIIIVISFLSSIKIFQNVHIYFFNLSFSFIPTYKVTKKYLVLCLPWKWLALISILSPQFRWWGKSEGWKKQKPWVRAQLQWRRAGLRTVLWDSVLIPGFLHVDTGLPDNPETWLQHWLWTQGPQVLQVYQLLW